MNELETVVLLRNITEYNLWVGDIGTIVHVYNHAAAYDLDNIFVERLWRTVKYEDIYLKQYADVRALTLGLTDYFQLYNYERPHQSLQNCTPAMVYQKGLVAQPVTE